MQIAFADPENAHTMDKIINFLVQHGYAILAIWVFAEQFGFPISSLPLPLAGGLAAWKKEGFPLESQQLPNPRVVR